MTTETQNTATTLSISTVEELLQSGRATISVREAALILELDERTVHRAIADGQIRALGVGKKKLIPRRARGWDTLFSLS